MSFGNRHLDEALDRHITGNYGEDLFKGCQECLICGSLVEEGELILDNKGRIIGCSECTPE